MEPAWQVFWWWCVRVRSCRAPMLEIVWPANIFPLFFELALVPKGLLTATLVSVFKMKQKSGSALKALGTK